MNLNSWDYYDLEKEMQAASLFELLEMFKREDKKYSNKCGEYVTIMNKLNEEGKKEIEKKCEFLQGATIKIALRIAERLTK